MSAPNAKTRQLSLPEVLREGFSGISATSSDTEIGDPSELSVTVKAGTKKLQKKRQLTGETPNPPT